MISYNIVFYFSRQLQQILLSALLFLFSYRAKKILSLLSGIYLQSSGETRADTYNCGSAQRAAKEKERAKTRALLFLRARERESCRLLYQCLPVLINNFHLFQERPRRARTHNGARREALQTKEFYSSPPPPSHAPPVIYPSVRELLVQKCGAESEWAQLPDKVNDSHTCNYPPPQRRRLLEKDENYHRVTLAG